ncbi:MAG: AAA family ATPase [Tannerellaceae bacterium]|nr:AAA family ATPase [Tannerellaceae bacterium]
MKILAIRGKNIASLEGEFGLDFTTEPLFSSGIFAISGPTGAGKSTLLDVMCLALFARTPRTTQAKESKVFVQDVNEDVLPQSDPRFLLRRGTYSGYAEVDFLGLTGHCYRARWSVGRARDKETGKLQGYRMGLFNLDKEEEVQGNKSDILTRIEELVGLTFEQFTRSVLLAQNDFSTFLKADQGEKASLLEKLTGTEHYSQISKRVYEKTGVAKSAYEQVASRIAGIELLPEDAEKELNEKLQDAQKQLERLVKLKLSKQELTDRVQASEKLTVTKKAQQKETAIQLEKLLTQLFETNKQIEKEKAGLAKAEEQYKVLQPQLREAVQLDVEIRSYTPVVEEAKTQWKKAEQTQSALSEALKQLTLKMQQAEGQVVLIKEWFERFRDKEKVANQIEVLLIHLDDAFSVRKTIKQSEQKISALVTRQKELENRQRQTASSFKEKEVLRHTTEEKIKKEQQLLEAFSSEKIEEELSSIRKDREELLVEKARFIVTGDIRSLRDKLVTNEPCPVCGSCEHPYASPVVYRQADERDKQIATLTLRLEELGKLLQENQKRQQGMNRLQQQLVQQEKDLSQCRTQLSELENQLKIIAGQLESEQIQLTDQQKRLKRSLDGTSTLFGNEEWQPNWLANPEKFRSTLVSFAEEWNHKREQLKETEKQVEVFRAEVAFKREQLLKEEGLLKDLAKNYEVKQAAYERLTTARARLLDGRPAREVEEGITRKIEQHRKLENDLQAIARKHSAQVDQTKGVSGQIMKELEQTEKEWEQHTRDLLAWMETNNVSPEGLTIEQEQEQYNRQKNDYSFRLRKHEENRKKVAGFQKELETTRNTYEQWAKLNDLVGSSDGAKFRKIAQGYTLDVLINYANVQLKNLTHRYRLERVPDTLALQVIDRDMCDEVRTVHSLSGGESFLVSLALALGLSSLSSNRMKVESLFIDEGFGSLDSDTLRVALDALESLRTQGRKIGVISHVQEMTERIPVQVKVCRSGNGRSYLEII